MFVWIKEILRINVNTNKEEKMINAINKQKLNVVIKLLKYDINVNYVDATGNTALIVATESGNLEIVNILILNNADFNHRNNDGFSALAIAVINGYTKIEKLINQVIQLEKENLINFKKMINKFNGMLEEKNIISVREVAKNFIKVLQYYQFYNNKKNKNINCELNIFF